LEPFTVSVKPALPVTALAGESGEVVAGAGLFTVTEIDPVALVYVEELLVFGV
jgi:hypothetical protein